MVMFPQYTRDELRAWVEKFTRLFLGSIYKWVQAPIPSTSATSILTASAPCNCPSCKARNGRLSNNPRSRWLVK